MSDHNPPESACMGKHGFYSKQMARRAIRRAKCTVEVYRCPYCGLLHIGSSLRRARRLKLR